MEDKIIKIFDKLSYDDPYYLELYEYAKKMKEENIKYDMNETIKNMIFVLLLESYFYQALFIITKLNELKVDDADEISDKLIKSYHSYEYNDLFDEFDNVVVQMRKKEQPFYYSIKQFSDIVNIVYLEDVDNIYDKILYSDFTKKEIVFDVNNCKRYTYPYEILELENKPILNVVNLNYDTNNTKELYEKMIDNNYSGLLDYYDDSNEKSEDSVEDEDSDEDGEDIASDDIV